MMIIPYFGILTLEYLHSNFIFSELSRGYSRIFSIPNIKSPIPVITPKIFGSKL